MNASIGRQFNVTFSTAMHSLLKVEVRAIGDNMATNKFYEFMHLYVFLYLGDLTEHIQPTRGLTVTCFVQSFKIYTYKLRYILNSLQKTYITLAAYTWYFNTCEVMSVKDN